MKLSGNILKSIGNTPLVELRKVVPPNCARIAAKLEWANPTGSMKDRMAKAVIECAEADGRLSPDSTVVEYTSGTTGVSLALACAAKGYRFHRSSPMRSAMKNDLPCGRSVPRSRTFAAITRRLPRN